MLEYYKFKKIYEHFLKGEVSEAKHLLRDLQSRYVEMAEENSLFKLQVQEFEDILYFAKNLGFDGTCYWLNTGALRQGPFCCSCYSKEGRLTRLSEFRHRWFCSVCGEEHSNLSVEKIFTPHSGLESLLQHLQTSGAIEPQVKMNASNSDIPEKSYVTDLSAQALELLRNTVAAPTEAAGTAKIIQFYNK